MILRISQIAIYLPFPQIMVNNLLHFFPEQNGFYSDKLKMDGFMNEFNVENIELELSFNHQFMKDCELEFINSTNSAHWHSEKIKKIGNVPFLSHLGMYCNQMEFQQIIEIFKLHGIKMLQNTNSKEHTNKRPGDGEFSSRKYQDIIYDTEQFFGFNLKLTRKI